MNNNSKPNSDTIAEQKINFESGHAAVNGINMYYEIHGSGSPLVLIHGGGSTINTNFGKIIPQFAKSYKVIAVELQAHGRTTDRNQPSSFEQDADDVAALLDHLKIDSANILGFSNGGNTAMKLAMRHPEKVSKLIVCSSFYKRSGMQPGFWDFMDKGTFNDMPQVYKDAFLKVNNDTNALHKMWERDAVRMKNFKDWKEDDLRSIKAKVLIVSADHDVTVNEHPAEMQKLISGSRLVILPGTHGSYMNEAMTPDNNSKVPELFIELVNEFLAGKGSND
jgi:pimeloyl-ACP methyl ester carboxylesterase